VPLVGTFNGLGTTSEQCVLNRLIATTGPIVTGSYWPKAVSSNRPEAVIWIGWNRGRGLRSQPHKYRSDSYHDFADLLIGFKETVGILDVAKRECLGDDRAQRTRLQPLQNKCLRFFQGF